ncbi:YhjD/YihY/BrkB family envelope integrity protein [Streptomyces sp. NRRL B-24572]|uniref:YhjD/YihY/BrkB family envelope integrity protein n=1 Tax=Streptomyces sp. NRRL B-24572 TaxID=1962156 RepID=UPI000A3A8661|nr:YhjD/YihY/BrkB family envelope integrity protein [Streptomyces sp. NRRL B-24572]
MPVAGRVVARLARVNTMEAAARLAAQTFLAALPLVIIVAAFAPQSVKDLLVDAVRSFLGDEAPTDDVEQTFTAKGELRSSIGVAGVIVMLLSATALSRALQQVCERCWDLPKGSARLTAWRWLVWILGWLAAFLFQTAIRQGFGGGTAVGVLVSVVTSVVLWWWTQHLLLGARIGWAPLLPGALLTGAGMTAFGYASPLVMPQALEQSRAHYGSLGYVFTFLSWLIAGGCVIVVCVALGQVVATSGPFPRWLGTPTAEHTAPPAVDE